MVSDLAQVPGQQVVVLSQVLADTVNVGYEDLINVQVVKFNGTRVVNLAQLARLVEACRERFLRFELDREELVFIDREAAVEAAGEILRVHSIPSAASPDILLAMQQETQEGFVPLPEPPAPAAGDGEGGGRRGGGGVGASPVPVSARPAPSRATISGVGAGLARSDGCSCRPSGRSRGKELEGGPAAAAAGARAPHGSCSCCSLTRARAHRSHVQ